MPVQLTTVVGDLLGRVAGGPVRVGAATPAAAGWSADRAAYPWLLRLPVHGPPGWDVRSVVVKTGRPDRARPGDPVRERVALQFLAEVGCAVGPRLIAHDDRLGLLVLEDLGAGPGLEDLLVGTDPDAATRGFVALAQAAGRLHAATRERAEAFRDRLAGAGRSAPADHDRSVLAGTPFAGWWSAVTALAGADGPLPPAGAADGDVARLATSLTEPDSPAVLATGDLAPQNCRLGPRGARLLDFEAARFQSPFVEAAHLRLPFYGAPCWSRVPAEVGRRVERAYRDASGGPPDDPTWAAGMAAATAAWAVVRLARLPKLLAADPPHPMGFSRLGQLLDTLGVAVDAGAAAGSLPALTGWLDEAGRSLRRRWPHLPPAQPCYPAYLPR
ncbi:hypothetical protein ACVCAH_22930 [Micromonospora sp. LZ34]